MPTGWGEGRLKHMRPARPALHTHCLAIIWTISSLRLAADSDTRSPTSVDSLAGTMLAGTIIIGGPKPGRADGDVPGAGMAYTTPYTYTQQQQQQQQHKP